MRIPSVVELLRRQNTGTATPANAFGLVGEPLRLCGQLFTLLFSIGVINSGQDIGAACLQLNSANAFLDLASLGLNSTQAGAIVCEAAQNGGDLSAYNQTLFSIVTAGLYAVELASNYTGTTNPRELCTRLDFSPLARFGIDVASIQSAVCGAQNTTLTPLPSIEANATTSLTTSTSETNTALASALGTAADTAAPSSSGLFPVANSTTALPGSIRGLGVSSPDTTASSFASLAIENSTTFFGSTGESATASAGRASRFGVTAASPTGEFPFENVTSTSSSDFIGIAVPTASTIETEKSILSNLTAAATSLVLSLLTDTAASSITTPAGTGIFAFPNATAETGPAPTLVTNIIVVSTVDFPSINSSRLSEATSTPEVATEATGNLPLANQTSTPEFTSSNISTTDVSSQTLALNATLTTELSIATSGTGNIGGFPLPNVTSTEEFTGTAVSITSAADEFPLANVTSTEELTGTAAASTSVVEESPVANSTSMIEMSATSAAATEVSSEAVGTGAFVTANSSLAAETTIASTDTDTVSMTTEMPESNSTAIDLSSGTAAATSTDSTVTESPYSQNGPVGYLPPSVSRGELNALQAESTTAMGYTTLNGPARWPRGPSSTPRYYP